MSASIDSLIAAWAEDITDSANKSGFSGINIIEKILRDPGFSTGGSRHRVLWWPRNKRVAIMSRAMHQISKTEQICLIVRYGRPLQEDGSVFTKHDLAKNSSIGVRKFNEIVKNSRNKLRDITRT